MNSNRDGAQFGALNVNKLKANELAANTVMQCIKS